MTHYSNDYFDLAADKANLTPTRWSGGSRVLPEGHIRPQIALTTALISGAIALFATFWLVFLLDAGPLAGPLLLLSIFLTWSYSSPPLEINKHGLGELTGALTITALTPLVGFYLQAGQLTLLPILTVFPLACFQFAMLLVINIPDAAGDVASGKHTLVYYLGNENTVRLYLTVLALAYGSIPLLVGMGLPPLVGLALFVISPLGLWQGVRMARGAWTKRENWNSLGFWSVGLLIASVLAELSAYLLLALDIHIPGLG